jgi:hypothetical protein
MQQRAEESEIGASDEEEELGVFTTIIESSNMS